MGISKKWISIFITGIIVVAAFNIFLNKINGFKQDGELTIKGLKNQVIVKRDEKGMAYIFADSLHDALFSQGFVTAQDRYFSMEMARRIAKGQLSEILGEKTKSTDVRMRTIGFFRNAQKHEKVLEEKERQLFQIYADGINAFLDNTPSAIHLKLKIMGVKPEHWTVEDILTVMYYMGWGSSANLGDEIVAQLLVEKLGFQSASEIFPLNINPHDPSGKPIKSFTESASIGIDKSQLLGLLPGNLDQKLGIGSNNWVSNDQLSASGQAILVNDPHLNTKTIPGPFYPIGIFTPEFNAVGANVPGIPGMIIGRTDSIAVGVTNGYGDVQDLYVETPDPRNPDNYLEGLSSVPFEIIKEPLKIKDKNAESGYRIEEITIRLTKRGPIVSNVLKTLKSDKLFSLRWSPYETMGKKIGFFDLLYAKDLEEVRTALSHVNAIMLNYVIADSQGNIGWQTIGRIPLRAQKDSTLPMVVQDGNDNWIGWIPWEEMPKKINPKENWVGTCNHTTVTHDYPYYFSSHFSPSWRQRRLIELMESPGKKTAEDHWAFQRDTKNLMAERIVPIITRALNSNQQTKSLAEILSAWDFHDDTELIAPTVFQFVLREIFLQTYQDELGLDLALALGNNYYFWQERLVSFMEEGDSRWFDNSATKQQKETLEDIILSAGISAKSSLTEQLGKDSANWTWGKVHQKQYLSPIRSSGFGEGIVGGGSFPMPGSVESLHRGYYKFDKPYDTTVTAALRMVVDFSDPDKIMAVMPSGVSDRLLSPHRTDQIKSYMDGSPVFWWFSKEAIESNSQNTLILIP